MPCTFSHPLAVVPLRRLCPARLNFAALVIGSMSPDFGYYLGQFPAARFAHTVWGTFAICLPTGLLVLSLFYLLRRPLCFVLPQPHRAALMPIASVLPRFSGRGFLVAVISILLGAWTHTVWDSFTHEGAWTVQRLPILRTPLLRFGNTTLPASYILQQTSTFGAGAILAFIYFRWLHQFRPNACFADQFSDRSRYALLATLAIIALLIAVPVAYRTSSLFEGYLAFRVFVFRTGVYSAAVFIPLLVIFSIILYTAYRRSA